MKIGDTVKVVQMFDYIYGKFPDEKIKLGDIGVITYDWGNDQFDVSFSHIGDKHVFIELFGKNELELVDD